MSSFELIFEGPRDTSSETLRRLKGAFISELEMSVEETTRILESAPISILSSVSEGELQVCYTILKAAGGKVLIVEQDEELSDSEHFELSIDLEEMLGELNGGAPKKEKPTPVYNLDFDPDKDKALEAHRRPTDEIEVPEGRSIDDLLQQVEESPMASDANSTLSGGTPNSDESICSLAPLPDASSTKDSGLQLGDSSVTEESLLRSEVASAEVTAPVTPAPFSIEDAPDECSSLEPASSPDDSLNAISEPFASLSFDEEGGNPASNRIDPVQADNVPPPLDIPDTLGLSFDESEANPVPQPIDASETRAAIEPLENALDLSFDSSEEKPATFDAAPSTEKSEAAQVTPAVVDFGFEEDTGAAQATNTPAAPQNPQPTPPEERPLTAASDDLEVFATDDSPPKSGIGISLSVKEKSDLVNTIRKVEGERTEQSASTSSTPERKTPPTAKASQTSSAKPSTETFEDDAIDLEDSKSVAEKRPGKKKGLPTLEFSLGGRFTRNSLVAVAITILLVCGNLYLFLSNQDINDRERIAEEAERTLSQLLTTPAPAPAPPQTQATTLKSSKDTEGLTFQQLVGKDTRGAVHVSWDLTVRGNTIESGNFQVSTPKPPERTPEEIVRGIAPAPWLRRVELLNLRFAQFENHRYRASTVARAYIDQGAKHSRTITSAVVTASFDAKNNVLKGSVRIELDWIEEEPFSSGVEVEELDGGTFRVLAKTDFSNQEPVEVTPPAPGENSAG